jgi:hypothetical protein
VIHYDKGTQVSKTVVFDTATLRGCADRRVANVSMGDEEPT